ncbi:MAG TPA: RNA polymerase subunit sigma-24, partial [Clostridiales bacterium]|nr:RNA polymerase subunit sigma-24 [Clostridiales bacterium]
EGYQTAEIASILGKKDATVRSQLKRGRELLRETLGGSYEK